MLPLILKFGASMSHSWTVTAEVLNEAFRVDVAKYFASTWPVCSTYTLLANFTEVVPYRFRTLDRNS
jgi:hypothetical protein